MIAPLTGSYRNINNDMLVTILREEDDPEVAGEKIHAPGDRMGSPTHTHSGHRVILTDGQRWERDMFLRLHRPIRD